MPRQYQPTEKDRYILEEESDVTEINFVVQGEWAIAFNTYMVLKDPSEYNKGLLNPEEEVPIDMIKDGRFIA